MLDPNFVILYVDNPAVSADFYAGILGRGPVEQSPTFAMFALPSGTMLGLWKRDGVEPPGGGDGEIAFAVEERHRVTAIHREWTDRGYTLVQQPTDLDFGHTFVALDPDGHRLRVFHPATP